MPARIIDGKKIAGSLLARVKKQVAELAARGIKPKLVVVQVGDDPASTIYVNKKHKACIELGIASEVKRLPAGVSYEEMTALISRLNFDPEVHGILVQLPLPERLSHRKILETVAVEKDVDGLHPYSHGMNMLGKEAFVPATPMGILAMLKAMKVKLAGKNAVIIGRSNIVGKPLAMLLLGEDCTVTICHSRTENLAGFTKKADIIIAAAGKPKLVKESMVKKGAIVIDVGINRRRDGAIEGDVDFGRVKRKAGMITPVPGGVGPMTIASLMQNVVKACRAMEWPASKD